MAGAPTAYAWSGRSGSPGSSRAPVIARRRRKAVAFTRFWQVVVQNRRLAFFERSL
jgi:hypothetical protein